MSDLSFPYCIVYICGEWVIYAEPVTYCDRLPQLYCDSLPQLYCDRLPLLQNLLWCHHGHSTLSLQRALYTSLDPNIYGAACCLQYATALQQNRQLHRMVRVTLVYQTRPILTFQKLK